MLNFNASGYLVPNQPILTTLDELHKTFVQNYSSVERSVLFNSYCRYSNDLKAVCKGVALRQWINGSFATKSRLRPSDIDMVTFIDSTLILQLTDQLEPFVYPNSKHHYPGIDGYIVSVYEAESPYYQLYKSDELHWRDTFDTSRRNRTGTKHPKGFVEIMY